MTLRTERSPHLAGGMSHGPVAKRGEDAYVTGASEGYFTPCNSKTLCLAPQPWRHLHAEIFLLGLL